MDTSSQHEPAVKRAGAIVNPHPRELVGIFPSYDALEQAIDEFERSGFARYSLSVGGSPTSNQVGEIAVVLADDPKTRKENFIGTEALGDAEGAIVGAFAYVPAVSVAGAASAAGAGLLSVMGLMIASGGTGALIGIALATALAHRWYDAHRRGIENGGLLLWVSVPSAERERMAMEILQRHAAHHIHLRDLP